MPGTLSQKRFGEERLFRIGRKREILGFAGLIRFALRKMVAALKPPYLCSMEQRVRAALYGSERLVAISAFKAKRRLRYTLHINSL